MISTELKRAFCNRSFLMALAVGMMLALGQLATVVVPYGLSSEWGVWREGFKGSYPLSVFNSWMGATSYSIWSVLYFFLLPLLACLPHADSLYTDIKSGLAANIISRSGAKRYFFSKAWAVFLTGGAIGIIPWLVNLLGTALLVPALRPEATAGTFPVGSSGMLATVFYSYPWIYIGFYAVLCIAISGLLACACLVFSYLVANRFMVLVAPFLVCVIANFALGKFSGYSPIDLLNPAQVHSVQLPFVILVYGILLILEAVFLFAKLRHFETLGQ